MTLYYSKFITLDNLSNDKSYLEQIKKSFVTYDVPSVKTTGYITERNNDYKYLFGTTRNSKTFFIDKDDKLYILTDDEDKKAEEPKEETIVEPLAEEQNEETV